MEEKIVKPISNSQPVQTAPVVEPVVEKESKTEQVDKITDVKNEVKTELVDSLIPTEDYRTSPLWYDVVTYLGIDQEEWDGAKNEVSAIVDYVIRDVKSNESDVILNKLRELEDGIQKPGWETWLG